MSKATKTKPKTKKPKTVPASVVWFEIPADNIERAKSFYSKLFGWKIKKIPGLKMPYWHIDTGGGNDTPDGGMMKRQSAEQPITNYIFVASVDQSAARVEKLGGKVVMPKTAVAQMGSFAVCEDPEHNTFALWKRNQNSK